MKKPIGLVAALAVFSGAPSVEATVDNPYAFVIGTSAYNICFIRHGYLTSREASDLMYKLAAENDISDYQVVNIINSSSFEEDIDSATKMLGGCRSIIADFRKTLKRSKKTFVGKSFPTEIYYGVDPSKTFGSLNNLSPSL